MGAGEGQGRVRRRSRRVQGLPPPEDWRVRGLPPPEGWRDWKGGLPDAVLAKVAATLVAQDEAAYEAHLKERYRWMTEEEIQEEIQEGTEELEEEDLEHIQWEMAKRKEDLERIQEQMAKRKRDGNCLFVFARVCREWRKAQLKVGGPLRTRVMSDVILPGQVELAKWALAEGCPRENGSGVPTMAYFAALYEHTELAQWLCEEQGFPTDDADAGKQLAELWRKERKRLKKEVKERYARSNAEFLRALKEFLDEGGSLAQGDLSPQYRELVWQALQPLHTRRGQPVPGDLPFGWEAAAAAAAAAGNNGPA